jgi:hypothetical protein
MPDTLEYPYAAKRWTMLLAIAFFGVCGVFLVRAATTNDRGLIVDGLITLSPPNATIAYWCLAAASVAFVVIGAAGLMASRSWAHVVRLTDAELQAPKSMFARNPTVVRLDDVRGVTLQEIHRQRLLTVRHAGGSLTIAQSMLPGRAAFDALADALDARLQRRDAARGALSGFAGKA